jgi:hypothetical protein
MLIDSSILARGYEQQAKADADEKAQLRAAAQARPAPAKK